MRRARLVTLVMVVCSCLVIWGAGPLGVYGGDLEPPLDAVDESGQPVSTMHTLEEIFQAVTPLPTNFVLWENNTRFAVWDGQDDVVLDRATGLMWARDANLDGTKQWQEAIDYCNALVLGNRTDWRLPTIEELVTLMEPYYHAPPFPAGHPFVNVESGSYWSSTTVEGSSTLAWYVAWHGSVNQGSKSGVLMYVLPVRGSN